VRESVVGSKRQPRWLWHAGDHRMRQVFAYAFGAREDKVSLEMKAFLPPFGITRLYTDG
jgi:insertion element IS1 protein InsB